MSIHFPFDNTYAALGDGFFARVQPAAAPAPRLIKLNRGLADELGLDPDRLDGPDGAAIFAGQRLPEGADPIALAYAGHQFGNFVPQLGDGRAILLGEVVDRHGRRRDIQLKGSGRTPFSRMGDGRAALGPVLREYIVSEAMHRLGVPTTRSLAAVLTGDQVVRETALPGAVLTRVASSHIRVGTFQYFAARGDFAGVRRLADHVIARHYPALANAPRPYLALLSAVTERQARLVAQWMLIGFIHGVMNTDNCSIAGETIDYGPCAFLDEFNPAKVFSSIDQMGRYAYGNQPRIALWNLTRLAECLIPLIGDDQDAAIKDAEEALGAFSETFNAAYVDGLRRKLGLFTPRDEDIALAQDFLGAMAQSEADFTLTFRRLCEAAADPAADAEMRGLLADPAAYDGWAARWRQRLSLEPQGAAERRAAMQAANPAIIPRNHRIEAVIHAAVADNFAPFHAMLEAVAEPYADRPAFADYSQPPMPEQRVGQTFCGT